MGVTSLIRECSQLGVPVDIAKLTAEIDGLTADQVLELRLEQLLLARKLEMSEERRAVEAMDFQKQLEQVSKEKKDEVTSQTQKKEIKNLKAEIRKLKNSGGPGARIKKERVAEETDNDNDGFETFDWGGGAVVTMDQPNGIAMEEESARDHGSQGNEDYNEKMNNVSTSGPGGADDFVPIQPHSSVRSASKNRDDFEETLSEVSGDQGIREGTEEGSSSKPDDKFIAPESQGNSRGESESREDTSFPSEASTSAYHLGRKRRSSFPPPRDLDSISDFASPFHPQEDSEESGNRKASNVTNRGSVRCICPLCSKQLTRPSLPYHLFAVHPNDPEIFKCEPCCLGYFSEDDLNRHNARCQRKNSESSRLKCKFCSEVFKSITSCNRHEKMHFGRNGEVERAQCELCPQSFPTFRSLKRHTRLHHPQELEPYGGDWIF